MAKRRNEVSSSSMIAEILEANPDISAKDALSAMTKKGRKIHLQTFYSVKSIWKKNKRGHAAVPSLRKKKRIKRHQRIQPQPISDSAVEMELLRRKVGMFKDILARVLLD